MLWDSDRLLWSFAFFVSSNVSSNNLPKHLTILSNTDNLFSCFSLLSYFKTRQEYFWLDLQKRKTDHACLLMSILTLRWSLCLLSIIHDLPWLFHAYPHPRAYPFFLFYKLHHQAHDCREQITDTVQPVTIPNSCRWTLTVVYHSNSREASVSLFDLSKFYYVSKHIFSCI